MGRKHVPKKKKIFYFGTYHPKLGAINIKKRHPPYRNVIPISKEL